jgi:hypothetical protein
MIGVGLRHLSVAADELVMAGTILCLLIGVGLCLRGRGFDRLATIVETAGVFMAGCVGVTLLSFVLGTSGRPFVDAALAAIDRAMIPNFDWRGTMVWFSHRPTLMTAANTVYESIGWQPLALFAVLGLAGRQRRIWTILLAWNVTLLITCAVFAVFPGVGPYPHFELASAAVPAMRDPTPWHSVTVLTGLRDGTMHHIGFADFDGLVTFPSFHAAAAVILAWGAWSIRAIRWPAALLNGAMLVSAISVGGHYVIDIVAGCIVAGIGIRLACRIGEADTARCYFPPSRRVSAATQLARSIVLPSGSRASR